MTDEVVTSRTPRSGRYFKDDGAGASVFLARFDFSLNEAGRVADVSHGEPRKWTRGIGIRDDHYRKLLMFAYRKKGLGSRMSTEEIQKALFAL